MNKTCIVIVGPTAVGKTAFAIHVAQFFSTQIISADSRQCFRELTIGVAKPSEEELTAVHHHFINSHSVTEEVNAAVFEKYALNAVEKIFQQNDFAVLVGGTGLYIKAFCEGMDLIPNIPATIRNEVTSNYNLYGTEWLQEQIKKNDPVYFANGEMQNPQRMMRALEVKMASGKSITDFQSGQKRERSFTIIKIGLELPREELYNRINARVDKMMQEDLLKEVEALQQYKDLNSLQTVGYKELFEYLEEKISLEKAVDNIKLNSRHYAKRQLTWFKKDAEIKWLQPNHPVASLAKEISSAG